MSEKEKIRDYLVTNCDSFRGEYKLKDLNDVLIKEGYNQDDIKEVFNTLKEYKQAPKQNPILKIIIGIGFVLFITFLILAFASKGEASDYKILAFESDQIQQTNLTPCDFIREDLGKEVLINLTYKKGNETIIKNLTKEIKVIIGEEFCIDEINKNGCGVIAINYVDKKGIKRVQLVIAGQYLLNLEQNTMWTVAQKIGKDILFDNSFLLKNRTLSEINQITIQDFDKLKKVN